MGAESAMQHEARKTLWCAVAVGAALMGCGDAAPPVDTSETDAGVVVDVPSPRDTGPALVDAGTTPPMDAGNPDPPRDAGMTVIVEDVGPPTPPVDAGCVYAPVTLDAMGQPRNNEGQIRWCWPGEPQCFCDRDNDCYRENGYRPRCSPGGTTPNDAGVQPPRDTGVVVPRDTGVMPPADAGPAGLCSDPVPATTSGPQINLETINFNWSMQCYRPEDGSLFVFVEDTERQMVALRFYDYLNNGGPATGQTIDLATAPLAQRPFFVSGLSGIRLEPSWRADRSYLAYEGQVVFHQLQRTNPVGTPMRVEFRNVRLREVRQYTNGRCENVPNGARMFIRSLMLNLRVNNIHTDEDCIDWAGG